MKRTMITVAFVAILSFAVSSVSAAVMTETYSGTVTPAALGDPLVTSLPMFDTMGGTRTLTGVQVELSLTATPFAMLINVGSSPATFSANQSISFGFDSTNTWTFSHGSDSWNLTAPTVSTGTIFGSGQTIQPYGLLTLVGSNSAPVNLTGSTLSANLAEYIGAGTLTFQTAGPGQVLVQAGSLYGGGSGDLTGTASITYSYTPEPATMSLLALGGLALIRRRRK